MTDRGVTIDIYSDIVCPLVLRRKAAAGTGVGSTEWRRTGAHYLASVPIESNNVI